MFDAWFEDIGEKIKNWAIINMGIGIVLSVIAGVVCFCVSMNVGEEMVGIGFVVIVGGIVVTAAVSTLLYGFGELIAQTCLNASNTKKILQLLQEKDENSGNAPAAQSNEAPATQIPNGGTKTEVKAAKVEAESVKAEVVDGEKVCPKCGTKQRVDRSVCWSCGQRFVN